MAMKHYDVFLSHHSADKPVVEWLARKLEEGGVRPFLDKWCLIPGEPIQEALEAALDQSATCAVFIGAAGTGPWANEEMRAALARRVKDSAFRVIPVLLPGVESEVLDTLPHFLKRLLRVDFRVGLENEEAFKNLLAGIRGHAPKLTRENASPEQMRLACPYRGLSAFREEDEALFFGRERCAEKLLVMVRQQPFVAVLGASGSGKSSLAQAGLLPKLRRQGHWRIVCFRPLSDPWYELASVVAPLLEPESDEIERIKQIERLTAEFTAGAITLSNIFKRLSKKDNEARWLLMVDQFEELYAPENTAIRPVFIANVLQALTDTSIPLSIVLTLRSDFLGQTHSQPELSHAIANNHIILPAMNREELQRAIAEPASRAGFPLHDEVVDLLLEQSAGREGALPLLEFALTRIWDGLARGVEAAETLQQIGGVGGALANKAQDLFYELNEPEQQIARRAFRRMTRLGEGTQDSRRRVAIADIVGHKDDPQQVRCVLNHFAQPGARLITLADDAAEITHEALFEHWEALKSWLDAGRDDLRFHRQLEEAVKEWEAHKRSAGSLWRPPKLDVLRQYHQRNQQDMTALQVAFLQESERKEKQTRFWKRATAAVLVFLTVISVIGAMWAMRSERKAKESEQIALQERKKAEINEIEALSQTARALHNSYDQLSAVISAIKAGIRVKGLKEEQLALEYHTAFLLEDILSNTQQKNRWEMPDGRFFAVSSDGTMFALYDTQGSTDHLRREFKIWDRNKNEFRTLQNLPPQISTLRYISDFDPENSILTFGGSQGIRLWDFREEREISILQTSSRNLDWWSKISSYFVRDTLKLNNVKSTTFSHDGKLFASLHSHGITRIWDVIEDNTGKKALQLKTEVDFSEEYQRLIQENDERNLALREYYGYGFDRKNFDPGCNYWYGYEKSLVFSPNNQMLAINHNGEMIQLVNIETGDEISRLRIDDGFLRNMAFSPDGYFLVLGNCNGNITLWPIPTPDISTQRHDSTAEKLNIYGHFANIRHVVFSADGERLVAGGGQRVSLWKFQAILNNMFGGGPREFKTSLDVQHVAFSADEKELIVSDNEGTIELFVLPEISDFFKTRRIYGRELVSYVYSSYNNRFSQSPPGSILNIAYEHSQPNRELFAIGEFASGSFFEDGKSHAVSQSRAILWDIQESRSIIDFVEPGFDGCHVTFQDEKLISVFYDSHTLNGLLVKQHITDQQQSRIVLHDIVAPVAFSPGGEIFATGSSNNSVTVRNVHDGRILSSLQGHTEAIQSITFNYDGTLLASGGNDSTINVWGVTDGQLLYTLQGHETPVEALAFNVDSTLLASASNDHVIKVWNVKTGQEIWYLQNTQLQNTQSNYGKYIHILAFSPKRNILAFAYRDWMIRLWDIDNDVQLATFPPTSATQCYCGLKWFSFRPDGTGLDIVMRESGVTRINHWPLNILDDLLIRGCEWLQDYLQNPYANLSDADRALCDDILNDAD